MKQLNLVVAAAGTPVRFTAGFTSPTGFAPIRTCLVQAVKKGTNQNNATRVYVMWNATTTPDKANGFIVRLEPGESAVIPIASNESVDMSLMWVDAETNADELQVTFS